MNCSSCAQLRRRQRQAAGDLAQRRVTAGEHGEIRRVGVLVDAHEVAAPLRPGQERTPALDRGEPDAVHAPTL
jgi:hypothetical protein